MIQKIKDKFNNKKIYILGLGIEGKSTYRFLRALLPDTVLHVMDNNKKYLLDWYEKTGDELVKVYYGDNYLKFPTDTNFIFKSPGIPGFKLNPISSDIVVTSQTNEFLEFYKDNIIGVTGTKGKSTTSTLLYKILLEYGLNVELVGNIGRPPFDYIEYHEKDKIYVYELSSHQLEIVNNSPHIAILLNIFEEHLDHYISYKKYIEAKFNIGKFQNNSDFFIYGCENKEIKRNLDFSGNGMQYSFGSKKFNTFDSKGIFIEGENIVLIDYNTIISTNFKRKLLGRHNLYNIMCCLLTCYLMGLNDLNAAFKVISEFEGLEHRLEYVGRYNDIMFYNDSISTIPQATICAVESIDDVSTLIIGGYDREIDYTKLISYIEDRKELKVIFMPTVGHKIYNLLEIPEHNRYYIVDNLSEAVDIAFDITPPNKVCLLSPAAASYNYFKNFEDRGNKYKEYIRNRVRA